MADSNSLRVMCLFETGAQLRCSSEIIGLAAHIYHKFFRLKPEMDQFELFTFGAACIKLAHWFYEKQVRNSDITLVMVSVAHGPNYFLDDQAMSKLEHSIDVAAKVITINLNYQIDYKDTRMMTPGDLARARNPEEVITIDRDSSSDEEGDEDETDRLLSKNSRHLISSHRYLAHYLCTIKLLVDPSSEIPFWKISSIAWTYLTDFHWSPCVTQHYANHLACACLMMATETCRPELDNPKYAEFWKLINKKWNLIFCDDLSQKRLEQTMITVAQQYDEYERILQHEFNTYVIDPKRTDDCN